MPTRIAFIGTGRMGLPMAQRLLNAGFALTVYNRSPEPLALLAQQGATVAQNATQAISNADMVITMLPNGSVVSELLLGADGALLAAWPHTLFIDMSSIHPAIARDLSAAALGHGVRFMDAPVSGGTMGASTGTLAIMAGGPTEWFEEALPTFAALGTATLVGPVGSGQLCKLTNQLIVAITIGAVAEGLTLARAGGADPAKVREAIMGGFCQSRILTEHGARMIERNFKAGGIITNQIKDLDAALDVATQVGAILPLTSKARELFVEYAAQEGGIRGQDDHSALIRHIEALSGLHIP